MEKPGNASRMSEEDARVRLLDKFEAAKEFIRLNPRKCNGNLDYVCGLKDMLNWAIDSVRADLHNEDVDEALYAFTGKTLKDVERSGGL